MTSTGRHGRWLWQDGIALLRVISLPLSVAAIVCYTTLASAAELRVKVSPIPAVEGNLEVAVYDNADTFPEAWRQGIRRSVTAGEMQVTFDNLPPGTYAVLVYLDLNHDHQLSRNWFGIPTEPWGGSFNSETAIGSPKWEDVSFELPDAGVSRTIRLIVR